MSLLPSPCRATALSAARRLDTIDLEMELAAQSVAQLPAIAEFRAIILETAVDRLKV
ncbi:MAG: hypothetical protein K2Y28_07695 [Burkholderiaceae bacterium]|nr:hypothetical protein [Burkholderiaceae bacterium]